MAKKIFLSGEINSGIGAAFLLRDPKDHVTIIYDSENAFNRLKEIILKQQQLRPLLTPERSDLSKRVASTTNTIIVDSLSAVK